AGADPRGLGGAGPRALVGGPADDGAEVRAHGRHAVELAVLVAIHGDLLQALPDHAAGLARNLALVLDVAGGEPARVLRRHVHVLARELERGADRLAARIVELGPRIVAPHDEIPQQHARDGAVRHAVARIAGDDPRALVAGIAADVGERVHRLHHLPRPAILDVTELREALARPRRQARVGIIVVLLLPGLVVLAADDEQLGIAVAMEPNVVIRMRRAPVERRLDGAARHASRDDVGAIR